MRNDLRYGFRMLWKSPGFTLMAVVALALGIGANTAIFSVVNAVMIQRLPFIHPDRLVMVWEHSPRTSKTNVVNPLNFLAWRSRNHSFERIGAMIPSAMFPFTTSLSGDGEPEQVDYTAVSAGSFEVLGVKPVLGRWFTPQEDTPGNDRVVILSEGLWRRRYAADRGILGRQIRLDNRPFTVVGVMPAGFRFPLTKAELWEPLAIDPARMARGRMLIAIARLRDGVSVPRAQADMNLIASQLERERPDVNRKWGVTVIDLREQMIGEVRTPLLIMLGAVGLVLLIGCANVANLMLMRAAGREREIAIRAALGAGWMRIVRQLLIESVLLAAIGGALGLLIGGWIVAALTAALPDSIAFANLETIRIDTTVLLFTIAVSFGAGILFGIAPAFKAARMNVQDSLKSGGRGATAGRSMIRSALVVAEVALSMMLLAGAGLLIRSFARLANVDPGFDASHVLSMQLATTGRFDNNQKFLNFDEQMLERVRAVPGIEAAGTSHFLPLGGIIPGTGFWRTDHPRPPHGEEPVTEVLVVMPGYFAAMNIPLIRGRVLTSHDRAGEPPVVVVNQTLAAQVFPNENPIGKHLNIQWGANDPAYEIVGVVGDVRQAALDKDPKPGVFLSNLQFTTTPVNLVVRAHGDPRQLANAIVAEIHSLDHDMPVSEIKTMDQYVSESVAASRFNTILLSGFATIALMLAAVGIFGVVSYSVAQRTQEIGIRRALGADTVDVMRLVFIQGTALIATGVAFGFAGALGLTRLLQSLLFRVTPTDPVTFAAVAAILSAVALLACYLPARRAAQVDPMVALHYE